MHTPVLETERLILRKFAEGDLEALYSMHSDAAVNQFLPWFPLQSMAEARTFFEQRYARVYAEPCGYQYAICLKSDRVPIGYIGVSTEDGHDLGYGLCRSFWHQGIVWEAGRAVIAQVKRDGMPYITATHDIQNPRSGRVMRALGMEYRYSYKELWQPKNVWVIFRMYQLNLDGNDSRVYRAYWDRYDNHFVEKL